MAAASPTPISSLRLDPALFNRALIQKVHDVWFEGQPPNVSLPTKQALQRWFMNPDKAAAARFDGLCQETFGKELRSLFPEHLELPRFKSWQAEADAAEEIARPFLEWTAPTQGEAGERSGNALACVLFLDQMPRNIFRKEQRVIYSQLDVLSRAVTRVAMRGEQRVDLAPGVKDLMSRRLWFYMPLMHSEWVEDHELCTKYFQEMKVDKALNYDNETDEAIQQMVSFEEKHAVIVRQFGRYPYRNECLSRETTVEEQKWLDDGGERFSA